MTDTTTGKPVVSLKLNEEGKQKFAEATEKLAELEKRQKELDEKFLEYTKELAQLEASKISYKQEVLKEIKKVFLTFGKIVFIVIFQTFIYQLQINMWRLKDISLIKMKKKL